MTQEEKARAYDEALERARKLYNSEETSADVEIACETIFPELAESEDEQIRKAIIDFFKSVADNTTYSLVPKEDILAWLENQGKHEYTLKSSNDEDVSKLTEYITKLAKSYELNLPNRGYDIYAFAKDILTWLEKQGNAPKEVTCTQELETGNGNIKALVTEKLDSTNMSTDDDVRRRSTIQVLEYARSLDTYNQFGKVDIDKNIAWLEKLGYKPQGKTALEAIMEEKSPAESLGISPEKYEEIVNECIYGESVDKVVPKFKIGDWVVFIASENVYQVEKIENYEYTLRHILGGSMPLPFSSEELIRPWTIKDVKPGDVLVGKIDGDNYILIFKQIKDGWIETYGHYYDAVNRFCIPSQLFCRDYKGTFYPATKEQRDTLAKAMAEEGYTFDFEKKELKKIDTLLDLLRKMPSCITVDGIDYHFVLKKTIAYMAFYEGEGDGSGKVIFWMAGDLVPLLTAMLNKLKEEGLLE